MNDYKNALLTISGEVDDDLEIEACIQYADTNRNRAFANAWINETEAVKIIEHLQKVFDIEPAEPKPKYCKEHGFKIINCDPDCDDL